MGKGDDLIRSRLGSGDYIYMQPGTFFFNSVNNGKCDSLIHALLTPKHFVTYKKIRHVVIPQEKELRLLEKYDKKKTSIRTDILS